VLGDRRRLVYLSTTGVYGLLFFVDESTRRCRSQSGSACASRRSALLPRNWSWLVLRPAAIYGPGAVYNESIRLGRYLLGGTAAIT
jgi:nucleoside-diphosphate-sugar epimerase